MLLAAEECKQGSELRKVKCVGSLGTMEFAPNRSAYCRPASGSRMKRRSAINPTGAIVAVRATASHIMLECLSPVSGQYLANRIPEKVPMRSFASRKGTYDRALYEASCPLGAIAAAYSYTRGE